MGDLSVRKPRAASWVIVPGPSAQTWSVSWFIVNESRDGDLVVVVLDSG